VRNANIRINIHNQINKSKMEQEEKVEIPMIRPDRRRRKSNGTCGSITSRPMSMHCRITMRHHRLTLRKLSYRNRAIPPTTKPQ